MLKKSAAAVATGVGAIAGVGLVSATPQPAFADSPIYDNGGGGGCQAQWLSGPDDFRIRDLHDDGNHCYVNYGQTDAEVQESRYRVSHRNGPAAGWDQYDANVKGWRHIQFRVCENIGGGPDQCSSITGRFAL